MHIVIKFHNSSFVSTLEKHLVETIFTQKLLVLYKQSQRNAKWHIELNKNLNSSNNFEKK